MDLIDDPALTSPPASGLSTQLAAPLPGDTAADAAAAAARVAQVEAAYSTTPHFWHGIQLAPFAISREADWKLHRTALNAPPLMDIAAQPEAMIQDALRMLFFLAHDPTVWLSIPAMRQDTDGNWLAISAFEKALTLEEKIRTWSDTHVPRRDYPLAVSLFYQIFNAASETRATVLPDPAHNPERAKK